MTEPNTTETYVVSIVLEQPKVVILSIFSVLLVFLYPPPFPPYTFTRFALFSLPFTTHFFQRRYREMSVQHYCIATTIIQLSNAHPMIRLTKDIYLQWLYLCAQSFDWGSWLVYA